MAGKNAKIVRTGQLIIVEPFNEHLKSALTFNTQKAKFTRRSDIKVEKTITRMFSVNPDDEAVAYIPAGFTYRVNSIFEKLGYEVEFRDTRDLKLEKPVLSNLGSLRDWQKECLARLLSSDTGVCNTGTATGKTFMIREFCKVFPNTEIVVTSHATAPLRQLYEDLKEAFPGEVSGLGAVAKCSKVRRITICNIRSLLRTPIDRCKILIYDEVHGAPAEQRSEYLGEVGFANMYGFSASTEGRLDMKEPIIEAYFGPIIYRKPYVEAEKEGLVSTVKVHIYKISGPPIERKTWTGRQRAGIIRNERRNQAIAQVARLYEDNKALILAQDNLEHVFRLHRYLPEYTPVYAAGSMTKNRWFELKRMGLIPQGYHSIMPGQERALAKKFRTGEITKAIATSVWAQGVDFPDLQVVIRADGMPGKIEADQRSGRVTRLKEEGYGILVDFLDDFGSNFLSRSRRRLTHYRKLGYEIEHRAL